MMSTDTLQPAKWLNRVLTIFLQVILISGFFLTSSFSNRIVQADAPYLNPDVLGEYTGEYCPSHPAISAPATLGDKIYFAAGSESGVALWVSDGTPGGTLPYYNFPADTCVTFNGDTIHGKMIFAVKTGSDPQQMYVSDGTPQGTGLLADVPGEMIVSGKDWVYFVQYGDTSSGTTDKLWRTDGTPGGTEMIKDLGGYVYSFELPYIFVYDPEASGAYWYTDGTADGTVKLGASFDTAAIEPLSDQQAVIFNRVGDDLEIWSTDNTPAGTIKQTTFSDQTLASNLRVVGAANGLAFFLVGGHTPDDDYTYTLWQTDGTADGTVNVDPGFGLGYYGGTNHGYAYQNSLYFLAKDVTDVYLYRTGGKDEGGVVKLYPSGRGYNDHNFWYAPFHDRLYYLDSFEGRETLFSTDGDTAGPFGFAADHFNSSEDLAVSRFGFLTFEAYSEDNHWKVFYSDGTDAGTHALFAPDQSVQANMFPEIYAETANTIFFRSGIKQYGENAYRLWASPMGEIQDEYQVFLPSVINN